LWGNETKNGIAAFHQPTDSQQRKETPHDIRDII
jgi:hypothetical protein